MTASLLTVSSWVVSSFLFLQRKPTSAYSILRWKGFFFWTNADIPILVLSNPDNGSGFVALDSFAGVLSELVSENGNFGGVANWEYYNSLPGGTAAPYQWASWMAQHMAAAKKAGKREVSSSEALWRGFKKMGRRVRREAKSTYHHYLA